ncbi:hypothetical protein PG999_009533 [Apiospora kogelbergensis]|uniref:RDD family protein n=1 Tax=Apiospora kogelbergensis TaxID=1337665 RepID=A0AAW0QL04_9PEZI
MFLRRSGFHFHGAPAALQRAGPEPPGGTVVFYRDLSHFEEPEPIPARMISVAVDIIAASLCLVFFVLLALYGDCFMFILGSTMLQFSFPLSTNITACRVATVMCICFYVSTKGHLCGLIAHRQG